MAPVPQVEITRGPSGTNPGGDTLLRLTAELSYETNTPLARGIYVAQARLISVHNKDVTLNKLEGTLDVRGIISHDRRSAVFDWTDLRIADSGVYRLALEVTFTPEQGPIHLGVLVSAWQERGFYISGPESSESGSSGSGSS